MLVDLTTDTLQNEIDQHEKVLVQFSAGWCGNCRIMKPKLKKCSKEGDNWIALSTPDPTIDNGEDWLKKVEKQYVDKGYKVSLKKEKTLTVN